MVISQIVDVAFAAVLSKNSLSTKSPLAQGNKMAGNAKAPNKEQPGTPEKYTVFLGRKIMKESICEGVAKGLVALGVLVAVGLYSLVPPREVERPGFIIPQTEVVPLSGTMTARSKWLWGKMQITPDEENTARMVFSNHPDGEVFIEFHSESMNLKNDNPSDRFFDVYCGTHKIKTGSGYVRFERNFQVFVMFDNDRNRDPEIWFYGDLTALDADAKMASR